tara:strand:+ start:69 stop:200 length:132 start_codon:yes stop_codon:yes gene_type:complete
MQIKLKAAENRFSYYSKKSDIFLTKQNLRELIINNLDIEFKKI